MTADDVTLAGDLWLTGLQRDTFVSGSRGVESITGTAADPIRRLRLEDVTIEQFGGGGVYLQNLSIERTTIRRCAYAGIMLLSVVDAMIARCVVSDINLGGLLNCYGISASRLNGTTATVPRSRDVTLSRCLVEDVLDWVGIDTHGGLRIKAIGNRVFRCRRGIDFVAADDATPLPTRHRPCSFSTTTWTAPV